MWPQMSEDSIGQTFGLSSQPVIPLGCTNKLAWSLGDFKIKFFLVEKMISSARLSARRNCRGLLVMQTVAIVQIVHLSFTFGLLNELQLPFFLPKFHLSPMNWENSNKLSGRFIKGLIQNIHVWQGERVEIPHHLLIALHENWKLGICMLDGFYLSSWKGGVPFLLASHCSFGNLGVAMERTAAGVRVWHCYLQHGDWVRTFNFGTR